MGEYSSGISNDDLNVFLPKLDIEMGDLMKNAIDHPSKTEYIDKLLLDYNLYMTCIELQKSMNNDTIYLSETNLDDVKKMLIENGMLSYIYIPEDRKVR